jgi:hypothetical protein
MEIKFNLRNSLIIELFYYYVHLKNRLLLLLCYTSHLKLKIYILFILFIIFKQLKITYIYILSKF